MKRFNFLSIFIFVFILQSCVEDDGVVDFSTQPLEDYSDAYLVLNEGNFGDGVGTVSYASADFVSLRKNIFQTINGTPVGSVLQSGIVSGNQIYLVVNNSNKIEVVDRFSFESQSTIVSGGSNAIENPRYITVSANYFYLSNYGSAFDGSTNFVSVFNSADNSFSTKIPTPTDGLIDRIYTAGSFVYAMTDGLTPPPTYNLISTSTIIVINPSSNTLETTLTLSSEPNSAVVVGNDLYVLCSGYSDFSGSVVEEAAIWKIEGTTPTKVFDFVDVAGGQTATYLNIIGNDFYFVLNNDGEKDIYTLPMNGDVATDLVQVVDLENVSSLSGFTILNDKLFVLDRINYLLVPGKALVYDTSGILTKSISVGIFPGTVLFNPAM